MFLSEKDVILIWAITTIILSSITGYVVGNTVNPIDIPFCSLLQTWGAFTLYTVFTIWIKRKMNNHSQK